MELEEAVRAALQNANLEDLNVDFERTTTGRIGGVVTSSTFSGMPQHARQTLLWEALQCQLSDSQLRQIIALITLTSEELEEAA